MSFGVQKRLDLAPELPRSSEVRGQFVRSSDARLKSEEAQSEILQCIEHVASELDRLVAAQCPAMKKAIRKGVTLHIVHHVVMEPIRHADTMYGHDVRMTQRRKNACFAKESLGRCLRGHLRKEDFNGHSHFEVGVAREKHDAHPAAGQLALDVKVGRQRIIESLEQGRHEAW